MVARKRKPKTDAEILNKPAVARKTLLGVYELRQIRQNTMTLAVVESIVYYLNMGIQPRAICKKLGVSEEQFYSWKQRGKEYLQRGAPAADQLYGVFYESIEEAEADWEINIIYRSFTGRRYRPNWYRDKWLLARRRPEDWSEQALPAADETEPDETFL